MKRLYIIMELVLIMAINTYGQEINSTTSGHLMFGGSINMDSKKVEYQMLGTVVYENHHEKNFSADIHLGYFAFNNFAAGMKVDFLFNRYRFESGETDRMDIFLIEPFIRYYTPFGLFGEGAIGYGFYKHGLGIPPPDDQVKNAWSIGLGYNLFITKNIALESIISYDVLKNSEKVDDQVIKFNGLSLNFGIQIYLNLSKTEILNN